MYFRFGDGIKENAYGGTGTKSSQSLTASNYDGNRGEGFQRLLSVCVYVGFSARYLKNRSI